MLSSGGASQKSEKGVVTLIKKISSNARGKESR